MFQIRIIGIIIQAYYMKRLSDQEELYQLSGWDSIQDNLSYSDIYIKKLQQQISKVVSSKLPQSPSMPNRTHLRNKSKQYFSSKISSGHLKRDKAFLQQYIQRQKASSPPVHNSYFKSPSPETRIIHQTETVNITSQKHQHHKTSEIIINATKSPEEESGMLEKYILFSGINKQKSKKRRVFMKANSKEIVETKGRKQILCRPHKQSKIFQKELLEKIDQMDFQKPDLYASQKKGLKFPLFYRQLHSNEQHIRKDKYKSSNNLRQKTDLKFSQEFIDDNIFQARFVRA